MELKDKTIKEFQEIYKKEYKKDISWEDAREGAYSLMHLAKLIYDQGLIEHERNLRLEKEPKGFIFSMVIPPATATKVNTASICATPKPP